MSRPTASSIWTSFRSSGKRHLLITGGRKSGKTTLLAQLFPRPLPGLTSWAVPGQAVYLKDNETGSSAAVGRFDPSRPGPENRMKPCQEGFTQVGIPCLGRLAQGGSGWACIDEIGYLEAGNDAYCQALMALLNRRSVAAAVRKQDIPFLRELLGREDCFVVDLDRPYGDVGCVIMASGLGRRFGGNKLLADFCGQPMILRAIAATEGIFSRRVVVTRHREVAELCRERGVEAVLHKMPHRSDTVRLGLEAVGNVARCLFCPADQPLLGAETVAALALVGVNGPDDIWRPAWQGKPGAPVLFPRWCFPDLLTLPQGKGGGYVAGNHPRQVRFLAVHSPLELADADDPQTLEALRRESAAEIAENDGNFGFSS